MKSIMERHERRLQRDQRGASKKPRASSKGQKKPKPVEQSVSQPASVPADEIEEDRRIFDALMSDSCGRGAHFPDLKNISPPRIGWPFKTTLCSKCESKMSQVICCGKWILTTGKNASPAHRHVKKVCFYEKQSTSSPH